MVKPSDTVVPHLRAWRAERGLTQNELAEDAHVSRGTIMRAEAGGVLGILTATKLAKALGVTVKQLQTAEPDQA